MCNSLLLCYVRWVTSMFECLCVCLRLSAGVCLLCLNTNSWKTVGGTESDPCAAFEDWLSTLSETERHKADADTATDCIIFAWINQLTDIVDFSAAAGDILSFRELLRACLPFQKCFHFVAEVLHIHHRRVWNIFSLIFSQYSKHYLLPVSPQITLEGALYPRGYRYFCMNLISFSFNIIALCFLMSLNFIIYALLGSPIKQGNVEM